MSVVAGVAQDAYVQQISQTGEPANNAPVVAAPQAATAQNSATAAQPVQEDLSGTGRTGTASLHVEPVEAAATHVTPPAPQTQSAMAMHAEPHKPEVPKAEPPMAEAPGVPSLPAMSSPLAQADAAAAASSPPQWMGVQLNALPAALGVKEIALVDGADVGVDLGALESAGALMDISQAMARGVQRSPDIAMARAVTQGSAARVMAAQAQLYAHFNVSKSNGRGAFTSPGSDLTTDNRAELYMEMRQPVINMAGRSELSRQKVLRSVSDHDLRSKQASVALDSGLAFLSLLSTQGRLDLTLEYEARLQELLAYIKKRASGGMASATEADRVASRLEGASSDLYEARANLRVAMSNFVRLVGLRPTALRYANALPAIALKVSDAQLSDMVQDNPDLQSAREQVQALQEAVRGSYAGFWPKLDLVLSTQRNDNVGTTLGLVVETKSMLVMTYSPFSGGADVAAVAEALAKVDEQLARCEVIERQLRSDAETTLAGLQSLDARFQATQRQIKLDAGVVDNFNAQLNAGGRQLLDVLDAHQRLYQSRTQLLAIGVTQAQAALRLSYQTGRLTSALWEGR